MIAKQRVISVGQLRSTVKPGILISADDYINVLNAAIESDDNDLDFVHIGIARLIGEFAQCGKILRFRQCGKT